jgi:NAD(P)-dependent dehydrogenase (short-subunit alcohol dehydrogenase family)
VPSVVISGASTGIGRACALHLHELGWRVFAGVRKVRDGEALAEAAGSDRLVPILLDVVDDEGVRDAAETVGRAVGDDGLQGLVNNAGIAVGGPIEFVPIDDLRRQFEVNVFGLVRTTQAFLSLIRTGGGRVVNMSSQGGKLSAPFFGPYCASKFAVEAVSDSLRRELKPWGLHVAVVEPGAIDTPIWGKGDEDYAAIDATLSPKARTLYGEGLKGLRRRLDDSAARGIPPIHVARAVAHALISPRPKIRYPVGSDAKVGIWGAKWLGDRAMDVLVAREFAKP